MPKEKIKQASLAVPTDQIVIVRKLQKQIELALISDIPLGSVVCLASSICSRILDGEKPTKADILKGAQELSTRSEK